MRLVAFRRGGLLILAAIFVGGAALAVHARAVPARSLQLRITERDFHISAPKHIASGNVTVTVTNKGPDDHELIIVRATTARLPLRTDGLTANEEKLTPIIALSLEPATPGSVRTAHVQLRPGRYVLFCNMAGHFMAGMRTTLVVR
jgi:uncharacterized cupredoxin-like copper-binding protein